MVIKKGEMALGEMARICRRLGEMALGEMAIDHSHLA
jgi:hypothetical protein